MARQKLNPQIILRDPVPKSAQVMDLSTGVMQYFSEGHFAPRVRQVGKIFEQPRISVIGYLNAYYNFLIGCGETIFCRALIDPAVLAQVKPALSDADMKKWDETIKKRDPELILAKLKIKFQEMNPILLNGTGFDFSANANGIVNIVNAMRFTRSGLPLKEDNERIIMGAPAFLESTKEIHPVMGAYLEGEETTNASYYPSTIVPVLNYPIDRIIERMNDHFASLGQGAVSGK